MPKRTEDFERVAQMLKSIMPELDYPNDTRSKAWVMRAVLGSVDVPYNESGMMAICKCGWRGTMEVTQRENYDNGKWSTLAGRKGYHWNCPECGETVWKYYNEIS